MALRVKNYHKYILKNLELFIISFDRHGRVVAVSAPLLARLGIKKEKYRLQELISEKFISDLRNNPNLFEQGKFHSYRSTLKNVAIEDKNSQNEMYSVGGYIDEENNIVTLWQKLTDAKAKVNFQEGSLTDAIMLQEVIKPYVPSLVIFKALEAIKHGSNKLPSEEAEATIIFADLVGFTQKSEKMQMSQIVEMLNIAFSIIVRSIEKNQGNVDKFIGDGVMAIFTDPMQACIAAVEIQNQFYQLNELRQMNDQEPIYLRIGIHTGKVILSSVGVKSRMDWTALGDVVNTASRIEKSSSYDSVLISEDTYQWVKDRVDVQYQSKITVKGKEKYLTVYYLKTIDVLVGDKIRTLHLKEKNIDEDFSVRSPGIDYETQLSNRQEFEKLARHFFKLAIRKNISFLFFIFDIVNLDDIQKNFTIKERNIAIRMMAQMLKQIFRESDILGRIGESRFALLAIDTTSVSSPALLAHLQAELDDFNSVSDGVQLQVCAGFSFYKSMDQGTKREAGENTEKKRDFQEIFEEAQQQLHDNPIRVI